MTPSQWLTAYQQAWHQRDPAAAAALFTTAASYSEQPYQAAIDGSQGIHAYWAKVTATQSDVAMRFGNPLISGNRTAVEWWTTLKNGGFAITLAGSFMLEFDEKGLCSSLREYWHFTEGTQEPQAGWGE